MSSRHKKGKNKTSNGQIIPNVYPSVAGYPVPTPHWITPHPAVNYPYWYQPWSNMSPPINPNTSWLPPNTTGTKSTTPPPKPGMASCIPDEYTVDSMRRIYNDIDGRIEIERVKVQRRQGIYGTKSAIQFSPGNQSLAPVPASEIRPPPRKNRRKGAKAKFEKDQDLQPQSWYPFMSYLPQPFPYLYPYGYAWPVPPPPSSLIMPPGCQSPTDESDSSLSRQEGFLVSSDLVQEKSRSPELQRPSSSAATSHIMESLGTDLAPSDSVSMRGFKRETSIERMLRKSLAASSQSDNRHSNNSNLDDMEKTKEWMEDMQKAFESKKGTLSDLTGDRTSFATASSDIPATPKQKITKAETNKKLFHRKSNSESNIDSQEDPRTLASLSFLDDTRVSDSDLIYSMKKQDQSQKFFINRLGCNKMNQQTKGTAVVPQTDQDGRDSCTSTTSFHSTRQSADENPVDTDSTDIAIPIDSSTADESVENFDDDNGDGGKDTDYKWILQSAGETSEGSEQEEVKPVDDLIEKWRADVSLWRARLVVSLCRGQGLDQQDWATFQMLVQHPLSMNLKLSLLDADRLCANNYDVGVALLRNALLHLSTFGETLMKPESERHNGWKTITVDASQPWAQVKGSVEVLRVFGYHLKEGLMKYKRKRSPETSVIARLTLDLLVLAEELRLFLTGCHQYPINIRQLFTSHESHGCKLSVPVNKSEDPSEDKKETEKEEVDHKAFTMSFAKYKAKDAEIEDKYKNVMTGRLHIDTLSQESIISTEENVSLNSSIKFSTERNNTDETFSSESIPKLQFKSQSSGVTLENQESGSRETLIPTPTPELVNNKQLQVDSQQLENFKDTETTKEGKSNVEEIPSKSLKKGNAGDNPEDHIYEEIGETKAQVQLIKETNSASQSPPPLPPKTKGAHGQDIYPNLDWSISSQYSSIHSGSVTRRKKRRAPVPPELFNQDISNIAESNTSCIDKHEPPSITSQEKNKGVGQKSPFYGNPFYEERILPSGYVGKNPFYEDIPTESSKEKAEDTKKNEEQTSKKEYTQSTSTLKTDNCDESEVSESVPVGGRPKRKKDRAIKLKPKQFSSKSNENTNRKNEPTSIKESLVKAIMEKSELEKSKQQTKLMERRANVVVVSDNKKTKNAKRELQCGSQVAVPNRTSETEGKKSDTVKAASKKDIILQKISITYDITLDDTPSSQDKTSSSSSSKATVIENSALNNKTSPKVKQNPKICKESKNENQDIHILLLGMPQNKYELEVLSHTNKENSDRPMIPDKKGHRSTMAVASDDKSSQDLSKDSESSATLATAENAPPLPPPKAALRLIDDIPYIYTHDAKNYKENLLSEESIQQPDSGSTLSHPYDTSRNVISALNLLHGSDSLPFIDEIGNSLESPSLSCPPTPPPHSPPSTPPLFHFQSASFVDCQQTSHHILQPTSKVENYPSSPSPSTHSPSVPVPPPISSFPSPSAPTPPLLPPPSPPLSLRSPLIKSSVEPLIVNLVTSNDSASPKTEDSRTSESELLENEKKLDQNELILNKAQLDILKNETTTKEAPKNNQIGEGEEHCEAELEKEATKIIASIPKENDDSNPKSTVIFRSDKEQHKPEICGTPSDMTQCKIPEPRNRSSDFEERYEIPDAVVASAFAKAHPEKLRVSDTKDPSKTPPKSSNDNLPPKRPPRHQMSFLVPPPRPPKPADLDIRPELPPKTGNTLNFQTLSKSLPSTLNRRNKSQSTRLTTPKSPLAIPEMYTVDKKLTTPATKSTNTAKSSSLSEIPVNGNSTSQLKTFSSRRNVSSPSHPPSKSASMPSSPKVAKIPSKVPKKGDQKQRSWPFLICDCVSPQNNNTHIKYVLNKP